MISWNDILTILISVVSVGADVIMVLVIYHLYQNVKKKNEKIQQNSENIKLLKLIKGSVKQEDLLPHCKKLTDVKKINSYFILLSRYEIKCNRNYYNKF